MNMKCCLRDCLKCFLIIIEQKWGHRMTIWQAFKASYSGSIAFLTACPLLALFPVAFELVQHLVEVRIGMYDSLAAAKAVEHDQLRMGFGFLKVIALVVPEYWVVRYLVFREQARAAQFDRLAVSLFAVFMAFKLGLTAIQLFGLPQTGPVLLATFFGGAIVSILIAAWGVAASLGNGTIGPGASIAIMWRQLPWTFVFSLLTMLPLMALHYGFAALALLGPKPLLWPTLVIDALLVGWLAAVMPAINLFAATRAAAKAGIALVPYTIAAAINDNQTNPASA